MCIDCNLSHKLGFDGVKKYCDAFLPRHFSSTLPRLDFFHVFRGVTVDIDVCRTGGPPGSCLAFVSSVLYSLTEFLTLMVIKFIRLFTCGPVNFSL